MGSHFRQLMQGGNILSMVMSWIHQGGIFFLFLLVGTVSGMDPGSSSMSEQISILGSQLSTLGSQLTQFQEQVEVLEQENMEYKERNVYLERRVSLLESVCGSTPEMSGSLMAIGGYDTNFLRSAEVLNTSCDFPLPESRAGHISVTTADGLILVCGGETSDGNYTASCLQFDYQSKSWQNHSTLLSQYRSGASAVTTSRGVYVLGGRFISYEENARNTSEFLATGSSVWTQGPNIPGNGVSQSCVAELSDTEFVILGGAGDETQARVYNEDRNEWREWPRLAVGVTLHSCLGLGDIVLMAGGYSRGQTERTVIFDSKTGSAREVAPPKYPRAWADMVLYRGKPLILGDGSEVRSDGEMWNMDTETWEEADIHLNIARGDFSLVTMAEEIECN